MGVTSNRERATVPFWDRRHDAFGSDEPRVWARLSKILYYLLDNLYFIRLSESGGVVKNKASLRTESSRDSTRKCWDRRDVPSFLLRYFS